MEGKLLVGAARTTQQDSLGEGLANYRLETWTPGVYRDCGAFQYRGLSVVRRMGHPRASVGLPYFPPSRAFLVLIKQMPANT